MKNITNRYKILLVSILLLTGNSCKKDFENFLDQAPGVDVNENTIFTSKTQLDIFLATIYKFSLPSIYGGYQDATLSPTFTLPNGGSSPGQPSVSVSDEGDASQATYVQTNIWNAGGITPDNIIDNEDRRYYQRWVALRQIAIMIKRVDEVPDPGNYSGSGVANTWAGYKTRVKAEVKVLRAYLYLEMVKRYGGVPIVDQAFEPGLNINSIVPRANIEDVFKFIVKDCDEAYPNLEVSYSATENGRITKTAARAVKARALLYAASPLFNTATPYLNGRDGNDKLLCYGNYDINRWKAAADAAYDVLTEANTAGISLIDVPTAAARDPQAVPNQPVKGNYSNSWEVMNNAEVILTFQGYPATTPTNDPFKQINPTFAGTSRSGVTVPFNWTKKYENKLTGQAQVWPASGSDLLGMYANLDPRYKQSICYTGAYWNPGWTAVQIYVGGTDASYSNCFGGAWMHKLIQRAGVVKSGFTPVSNDIVDFILRLNEFYLDYAEAINEFSGPGLPTTLPAYPVSLTATLPAITAAGSAYDAVNKIRLRSGMPPLPAGLSQAQFRDRVRNERGVELYADDHRFWDIKRWMIAEQDGVMQGGFYGITNIRPNGTTYSWEIGVPFETRVWFRKEYLHPFPASEVLKGGLVQNPGW